MRVFQTALIFLVLSIFSPCYAENPPLFEATLKIEIGEDLGQGLGTLFEAIDEHGRVILGAGLNDIHSTYVRDNNRILDFYYRGMNTQRTFQRLTKPFSDECNGSRLILDGDHLLTYFREGNPINLSQVQNDGTIKPYEGISKADQEAFSGIQYVNNHRLVFHPYRVTCDGKEVYRTDKGSLYYYVKGKLFVYQGGEPGTLLVYKWNPSVDAAVTGEPEKFEASGYLFIYGTSGDEVVLVTNIGCIYSYKDGHLTQLRDTDGQSWQGYSWTAWYDHHVIGHYPTGSLMEYADGKVDLFEPAIPVPPGASSAAREAQTLTIYGGDLYAGVWPWGELWRLDSDTHAWEFVQRVFDKPEISQDTAPYEVEMKDKPDVINYWGQRIMNLVGTSDGLYISTMNKQGKPYNPKTHDFMTPEIISQYGMLHKMSGVVQVSKQLEWKPVTELRFTYDPGCIRIYQDGKLLEEKNLSEEAGLEGRTVSALHVGKGVYGPFAGKVLSSSAMANGKQLN
ncbi:MAG: hypothetical protein AMXMBFR75_20650 [Candidatus Hinthialibacteria bacterium]